MPVTLPERQAVASPEIQETPLDLAETMRELAPRAGPRLVAEATEFLDGQAVYAALYSKSRVDVGLWWVFPRLWLFVCDNEVRLGAWAGPKALPASVSPHRDQRFADLRGLQRCHWLADSCR